MTTPHTALTEALTELLRWADAEFSDPDYWAGDPEAGAKFQEAKDRARAAIAQAEAAQPVADALADLEWIKTLAWAASPVNIHETTARAARVAAALFAAPQPAEAAPKQKARWWSPADRGELAGDGKPCPNTHDPDCRWPRCLCRKREAAPQTPATPEPPEAS